MVTKLQIAPMTAKHAAEICTWHYPKPYDVYNWPSWDVMTDMQIEFADDHIRTEQYRSIVLEEQVIGFIQLFPLLSTLRLALFLSPDHCDQGYGKLGIQLAIEEARKTDAQCEIDLEVECWNTRAIRCYERAGFVITDEYELPYKGNIKQVYCMVLKV